MHLFVTHDDVLTAFVSVIKQSLKAHGPLVITCYQTSYMDTFYIIIK